MRDFIGKIRKAILLFLMQRQLSRRSRKRMVMGFDEARTVGVIYDASTAAEYRLVLNYVKSVQDLNKNVKCLGFYEGKRKPGYLTDQLNWSYCQKADFGWTLAIKSDMVVRFLDEEFDVLIDLSPTSLFYTKYLAAMSHALYKVGRYHTAQINIYDLLIQVADTTKLQELMDHVNHYLKIIKKPIPDAKPV